MMRCNVMRCEYQSQRRTKVYWHTRQNAKMSPQLKSEKQSRASNFSTKTLVKSIIFRLNFAAHEGCRSRLMAREPLPLSAAVQSSYTHKEKEIEIERESTEHRPRHHFKSFSIRLRIPFVLHYQMLNYVWHNTRKYLASKLRAKVSH